MLESVSFESQVRLWVFLVILVTLVVLELLWPRRGDITRRRRWPANFGVFALNVVMLAILPVTAVLIGVVALRQVPSVAEGVGIAAVVVALVIRDRTGERARPEEAVSA